MNVNESAREQGESRMDRWEPRLKDRVAIVTGGGGGLGAGICRCLADEGAKVVVSDVNLDLAEKVAAELREEGQEALAIRTDVRSAEQCQTLVETTIREMGHLDILVCAAGVGGFDFRSDSPERPMLETISEEDWDLIVDVNLKGVFLCNRAVAPHFKKQRSGKIVNIASICGRKGVEWLAHSSASKAGVIVLTQSVALQLARYNVNVNTVCPGLIWTPMWAKGAEVLSQSDGSYKGMSPEEIFRTEVRQQIPLGRPQTPEAIGKTVVFLASSEAEEITGQAINVDGGAMFN
jgi:meso-butanediol dehydrogenase/(S,S)-butanediol dehydrogenase/diacetyl reductase